MNIVAGQGMPDFVMLDTVSEDSFMENLTLRFQQKQIYTYIGEQVVSMNPFTRVNGLYSDATLKEYNRKYMYEVQPHVFSLADDTVRSLQNTKRDQCVIVTGESGAGKTEAAKHFMQYLAAVTGEGAAGIKGKLLDSNPVLEAFGNAKTLRNDNSSRFGKYMEVQFNGACQPIGGKVSQYLLEKGRVCTRSDGERSFHVFYQLLSQPSLCTKLNLVPDATKYTYLSSSKCVKLDDVNDAAEFEQVVHCMKTLEFTPAQIQAVWEVLASILHLGQLEFEEGKEAKVASSNIANQATVFPLVLPLLGVSETQLMTAMTNRGITTGRARRMSTFIAVPLSIGQAKAGRDSLSKALYNCIFDMVVNQLNLCIRHPAHLISEVVVGVLDIYGFEIFEHNSFEQFCINYCNEKLQQLFIELVLKQEQEEYEREGIAWTKIDYFNNASIVTLLEGKPHGIISYLDETCLLSNSDPAQFLDKIDQTFGKHDRYYSKASAKGKDASFPLGAFRINHYAGMVTYETEHFISKNTDTLFETLKQMIQSSSNPVIRDFFPITSAEEARKRPPTIGTQFRNNLAILVATLSKCQPHYIRCIKPNDEKKAFSLNDQRVRHQCRYLNLVETVRVRKAGFCNRQLYARFFHRYKMISDSTWPTWKGSDRTGVVKMIQDQKDIKEGDYQEGKTKIFIRAAKTLTLLEERRHKHMPKVAIMIQRRWRGYIVRKQLAKAALALVVQKLYRGMLARKEYKYNRAASAIQRIYRGFKARKYITLHKAALMAERDLMRRHAASRKLQKFVRKRLDRNYLRRILALYPANGPVPKIAGYVDWPKPFTEASRGATPGLQKMHRSHWAAKKIQTLDTEDKRIAMKQKILGLWLFKGKKPWDVGRKWLGEYQGVRTNPNVDKYRSAVQIMFQKFGDSHVSFADLCTKVDKKGKVDPCILIVTDKHIFKYFAKSFKLNKVGVPLAAVKHVYLSTSKDSYMVIQNEPPYRDIVVNMGTNAEVGEQYSELATVLSEEGKPVTFVKEITFNNSRGPTLKQVGKDVKMVFVPKTAPTPGCDFKLQGQVATVSYPEKSLI